MPETSTVTALNVTTGKPKKTGAMFIAPLSTTLPTTAAEALNVAFVGLGYVAEDGVTNSGNIETTQIKAWGGDVVFDAETGKTDQWRFRLIEAKNINVLKLVHGDSNVTGTISTGISVSVGTDEHADKSFVIDMILRGGVAKRIVIPQGKVISVADVVYNDTDPVGYDVTISATPDSAGHTHYEYIKGA